MKTFIKTLLTLISWSCLIAFSQDYLYILDDKCINDLMVIANDYFKDENINAIRDTRGILLRFKIENPIEEMNTLSYNTYKNSIKIKDFLAKIENPVIIEVHTEIVPKNSGINLKNWEISTVIANKIESVIITKEDINSRNKINSVGYGEFLPAKNTPNNGGKYSNRVDIIILCNISGE